MELESIKKMTKDIREASITLGQREARYLVDTYYQMQDTRIRSEGQLRSLVESGEPNAAMQWFAAQNEALENQVRRALDAYSLAHPVGQWMRSQKGIGPVIAAGLLANIDIRKAPYAGNIQRFCGLDPSIKWRSSEDISKMVSEAGDIEPHELAVVVGGRLNRKPSNILKTALDFAKKDGREEIRKEDVVRSLKIVPYNQFLKSLCAFKLGECFVKVSGYEDATYGRFYIEKKAEYIAKNEAGEFKAQAEAVLLCKKIGKATDAYKAYSKGKLPPAHIHAMARRAAVKLFLSHLHEVWYKHEFGYSPKPYAMAILEHEGYIPPDEVE